MADDIMMSAQPSSSLGTSSSSSRLVSHDTAEDLSDTTQNNEVLLNVMLTSGHEQHIRVSKDITVRKVKQLCIPKYIEEKRLSDFESSGGVPGACGGVPGVSDDDDDSRFKLVHAKTGRCLADTQTLSDQSVIHSDSLLLLPRKTKPTQFTPLKTGDGCSRPSTLTIDEITGPLEKKNDSRNPKKDSNFNNYLTEMRKIILSLIYVSHRLLCHNKEAVDMFKEAIVLLKASRACDERQFRLSSAGNKGSSAGRRSTGEASETSSSSNQDGALQSEPHVDPDMLKQLTDMGFKPQLSRLALIVNAMSLSMATEWLLAHGDDDEDTTAAILLTQAGSPPPPSSNDPTPTNLSPLETTGEEGVQPMEVDVDVGGANSGNDGNHSMTSQDETVTCDGLRVLQEFHDLSFQPDAKALKSLLDMGFPKKESYDALRINGNHENFACEWLLNWPRRPTVEEWEQGIDSTSPMYKAIVSNPLVQLLLNNPKTLLALEDILGHPNSMSHYLNDPDAGPLLVQISSIYSTERHSDAQLQHNQQHQTTSSSSQQQQQQNISPTSSQVSTSAGASMDSTGEEGLMDPVSSADEDDSLSTLI